MSRGQPSFVLLYPDLSLLKWGGLKMIFFSNILHDKVCVILVQLLSKLIVLYLLGLSSGQNC